MGEGDGLQIEVEKMADKEMDKKMEEENNRKKFQNKKMENEKLTAG